MLLVVDHQYAEVRCDRDTLILVGKGASPRRVPVRLLENVVVMGNIVAESRVWLTLAEAGVPTTFLPVRGKPRRALISAGFSGGLSIRRRQFRCADSPDASLRVARWIVGSKLESYALPLRRFQKKHPEGCEAFARQRDKTLEKLEEADSVESLMGLEGSVASAWFSLLGKCLAPEWRFTGRNRRPPRDPVNAMLSLGYTLLMADIHQMLIIDCFDPSLGFLHQDRPGREGLTLDMTELFRAGVDDFVIEMASRMTPDEFTRQRGGGCLLTKAARPLFYAAWAGRREQWPRPGPVLRGGSRELVSPLRERIRGRIAALRHVIKIALEG